MEHLDRAALDAGLDHIRRSPTDDGVLDLIVRRPGVDEREVLDEGTLDPAVGLIGDTWAARGSSRTADGSAHPDMQLNVINARVSALVAVQADRRPLVGDQLHVDFDISEANAPAGTQLAIGGAVIEITDQPHTGCKKFSARFGAEAWRWVNSEEGRALHLRGVNARVVVPGTIRRGDVIRKV